MRIAAEMDKKNYLPREAKTEFTTSYDLESEEIFELQGIGHGGCREETARDHARQGEVEGNPRRYSLRACKQSSA